ncbi:MAG TPA: alpha-L-arabinofuranosidase C-terminal domain-containing protein, partial [Thermomicrobiales bacterium]|nr:alpha-L-arabinofuranosidase C-terminal domain-containing protein [Thermomicrobiales bacterium]
AMDVQVTSPVYENATFGEVPLLDAIATFDEANEELTIFAVNRSQDGPLPIEGDLRALAGSRVLEHLVLTHEDPKAVNTADAPETVVPHAKGDAVHNGGALTATLPALSWNVIRLAEGDARG